MFKAALFIIAKTWKPNIDRTMDKEDVVHIHSGILLSHKKECHWQQHGWTSRHSY